MKKSISVKNPLDKMVSIEDNLKIKNKPLVISRDKMVKDSVDIIRSVTGNRKVNNKPLEFSKDKEVPEKVTSVVGKVIEKVSDVVDNKIPEVIDYSDYNVGGNTSSGKSIGSKTIETAVSLDNADSKKSKVYLIGALVLITLFYIINRKK
jgi:uncharacterized protein YajQ (UPF0234 family)